LEEALDRNAEAFRARRPVATPKRPVAVLTPAPEAEAEGSTETKAEEAHVLTLGDKLRSRLTSGE
jgi:hypothetical protein